MSILHEVDVLKNIPIFNDVEESVLQLLALSIEKHHYKKGDIIFKEGDYGDFALILLSGCVDILLEDRQVAKIDAGHIIGEMAILGDVPRTATVKCADDVSALYLYKTDFFKFLYDYPQIAVNILRDMAEKLHETTAKLSQQSAS